MPGFGSVDHQVEVVSLERLQIRHSIQYPTPAMDSVEVNFGPFTQVIERYLMKFGEDADGKCR